MIHYDREISVPADFAVGLQTERPELLRRIDRALTQTEGHAVADAMGTLLTSLMRERDRADAAEDRLSGVGLELTRIKGVLQKAGVELGAAKLTELPEPMPGDDDGEVIVQSTAGEGS